MATWIYIFIIIINVWIVGLRNSTSSNKEYIKGIAKYTYINLFMKTLLIIENGENKVLSPIIVGDWLLN